MTPSTAQPTLALTICSWSIWKFASRAARSTGGGPDGPLPWVKDTTTTSPRTRLVTHTRSRCIVLLERGGRETAIRANSRHAPERQVSPDETPDSPWRG